MPSSVASTPDLASKGALHRTIPNAASSLAVSGTQVDGTLDAFGASSLDLRGHWVTFLAVGAQVTILRYDADGAAPTLTAGTGGLVIAAGASIELWVEPASSAAQIGISAIGDGAGSLEALIDAEIGG
jgi:hypothetical protein